MSAVDVNDRPQPGRCSVADGNVDLPSYAGIVSRCPEDPAYVGSLDQVAVDDSDLANSEMNELREGDGTGAAKPDDGDM